MDNITMLTEKQVAEKLQVSVAWVRNQRSARNGIPFFEFGKAVRYRVSDLARWLDSERALWFGY